MASYVVVTVLFLAMLIVQFENGYSSVIGYEPLCPVACLCNVETHIITCRETMIWESTWHDIKVINEKLQVQVLMYQGEISDVPREVLSLKHLQHLSLAHSRLKTVSGNAFHGLRDLMALDLSYNQIAEVTGDSFSGLAGVHAINLSRNCLSKLPEKIFEGLTGLKTLNLSGNQLVTLPRQLFVHLGNLETLDLSHNKLTFLSSDHVVSLYSLKTLDVSHNQIPSLHYSVSAILQNMSSLMNVDISGNPLDCSCSLAMLLDLMYCPNKTFMNLDRTLCSLPTEKEGIQAGRLTKVQLQCNEPLVTSINNDSVVYHRTSIQLHCDTSGLPKPAVIWQTPWGHLFSHSSSLALLGDLAFNTSLSQSYSDSHMMFSSKVTAKENGILLIENFRSAFQGNFCCHVINSVGNDSAIVRLDIASYMKDIYYMSLFYSLGSSGAFLILGIIIGSIKVLVMYIQKKCCLQEEEEEEKKPESITTLDEIEVFAPELDDKDHPSYNKDDPDTPPTPCVLSSDSSSSSSPQKCTTPSEEIPTGWIPSNIVETLEEVRGRLRYGVERKMEKVRSQVKMIKESGSTYVHNIKESGIQAADRVKAGVVLGVESLKFTAQSFKEFCGTGDMGGQTISMVSVSTDIDTSERTEVVRTVTFV